MAYDERREVARRNPAAGSLGRIPAGRKRMPLSERAKIFQPFNPLKGFEEALRQKEREAELAALEGDGVSGACGPYEPDDVPQGDVPWGDAVSGGA